MKRTNHGKVVFKEYQMNQLRLPMSLEELIPESHLVRVVNSAIERMNIDPLVQRYKGGGTSSYHPKMMLKVLVYAYTQKVYSSRQIAKALRENINFMWLSGNNKPDFRTINRFRSSVIREVVNEVFTSVLELLIQEGYVRLENYFLDGTKIEANANKYTWVWGKTTRKNKEKLQGKIKELLEKIEKANEEEDAQYGDSDLDGLRAEGPMDSKKLEEKIRELDERLARKGKDRELTKAAKTLKGDYLPRLQKYEDQEEKLKGRNSYSKTDEDATFMRMKEDHMRNGQLKPGYNVQIGTENQFVVGYSIHQNRTDTGCLIPHLEQVKEQLGQLPKNVIADSGYGSEENYEYLEAQGVGAYVKYSNFHLEQKRSFKKDAFRVENFPYDEEHDEFICPAGQRLKFVRTGRHTTENGYRTERRFYECKDCEGCPLKARCTRSQGNRCIRVSFRLNELKQAAAQKLLSEEGLKLRSQRTTEPESVFGRIKNNWSFRRFMLRGLDKVRTEWGLLSIAHNLAKLATT